MQDTASTDTTPTTCYTTTTTSKRTSIDNTILQMELSELWFLFLLLLLLFFESNQFVDPSLERMKSY